MAQILRSRRLLAVFVLVLQGSLAVAADLGVPRAGFDRVLLDDGRVIDARALAREGDVIPLEFAAGTVRVPRSRVREIRPWRDFDPAPRDEAEKAKADQGFVRWNGVLVPPTRAEKLRAEEIEKERNAREAELAAAAWDEHQATGVGRFSVHCNAASEERKHWCAVLGALGKQVAAVIPTQDSPSVTSVYLYRDEQSRAAQAARDRGRSSSDWGHPDHRADVLLGDSSRQDLLPLVLQPAAFRLCQEIMTLRGKELGGWIRHGLPRYFAAASFETGALHVGEVDDGSLLRFREQEAAGKLPRIDDLLRSGNRYWTESAGEPDPPWPYKDPFDMECAPGAWVLVHFLLEGEDGGHRRDFQTWLQSVLNAKSGKAVDITMTYPASRDYLLRTLKMRDADTLFASARKHAEGLKYRWPRTWLAIARRSWAEKKDAATALSLVEEAVSRAKGSAIALREAGEACSAIAGGQGRAREILAAAVEADPLDAEARLALAKVLPPGEGEKQRSLGEALRGGTPAGNAAGPSPPK